MSTDRWLDEREQRAWRAFFWLQSEVRRRLSRQLLAETGLSGPDYDVLVCLSEAPGGRMRVFELREAAKWEKSRLTHHIGRMEQRGLVERRACPTDGRGLFVSLTEAGWAAIAAAAPRHVEHVRGSLIDLLTPEQLDALIDISDTIRARLDGEPEDDCC